MTAQASAQVQILEILEESLTRNIVIALDTGAGKTHIAVLRLKFSERCYGSHRAQWALPSCPIFCQACDFEAQLRTE
ncbi:hypothetical protein EDB85DRAFT_2018244 [Lactarius pseudohatsudake]|nr:hypothetical protein EDB85DRAFT_2018244 [Lactarius pseudohatsudake]